MKPEDLTKTSCAGASSVVVSSPIGDIEIHSCHNGLHLVKQCVTDDKNFSPNLSCIVDVKQSPCENKMTLPAEGCVEWLKNYFHHGIANQDIPVLCSTIQKGSFRCHAWSILPKAVPFGKTITYLHLANLCGNPKACRAAGSAMSNNPISFLIPCHRVLPSSGLVGNYSGGRKNSVKAWLLDFEDKYHSSGSHFD